jgi:NADPH2:quinone reductase
MKAIHIFKDGADADVLELTVVSIPELTSPCDVLVKLRACAINPVSPRLVARPDHASSASERALFKPGDDIFYAAFGGTNAEYHVVDS